MLVSDSIHSTLRLMISLIFMMDIPPKSIDAVYVYMERNLLKKHWFAILNDLKERWPDLNQSDLDYIGGDVGKLVEVVQNRKHISAEKACEDVEEFLSRLNVRQRIA